MNKTYQPFVVKKSKEIITVIKDEIPYSEHATEHLCDILTQKFIDGRLNENDDLQDIFEPDELMVFIAQEKTYSDLKSLIEMGLVGVYDDEKSEDLFFLTEKGKVYMEQLKKSE